MANFRRKRPKTYNLSTCGYKNCKFDGQMPSNTNGHLRYLDSQWKQVPYEGKNPWRHKADYISAHYNSQGL